MTIFTKTDALDLLRHATEERGPDFTYESMFDAGDCEYFAHPVGNDGVPDYDQPTIPACIIGVGLVSLGIAEGHIEGVISSALPELAGYTRPPSLMTSQSDAEWFATCPLGHSENIDNSELWAFLGYEATENATRVLWAAQVRQDTGSTWGEALEFATQVAEALDGE